MRLVQIAHGADRRVAVVEEDRLRLLDAGKCRDIYSLAVQVAENDLDLSGAAAALAGKELLEYPPIYNGASEWRLLPAFDHPADFERCLVSGTGLTHKASAQNRSAMHGNAETPMTDSMKMYRMGLEGGSPQPGSIGVQPEWFYKGNGFILQGHGAPLTVPTYACDGGEEPEIAGAYIVGHAGRPFRVGFAIGNEFSDHRMEKQNYLYLAPSKLRTCSIGPELTIGAIDFTDVPGTVTIFRKGSTIWKKDIWTGEKYMCHSLANLEHHQFKYKAHRQPGNVHIHFFGADAFSFGDAVTLDAGDVMEVSFPNFGKPLRNPLIIDRQVDPLVSVVALR